MKRLVAQSHKLQEIAIPTETELQHIHEVNPDLDLTNKVKYEMEDMDAITGRIYYIYDESDNVVNLYGIEGFIFTKAYQDRQDAGAWVAVQLTPDFRPTNNYYVEVEIDDEIKTTYISLESRNTLDMDGMSFKGLKGTTLQDCRDELIKIIGNDTFEIR
jgi:hypothetical protein